MNDILSKLMLLGSRRVDDTDLMRLRFQAFLRENPTLAPTFPIVKVTGTNGKGSVAAMLAASLSFHGKRTAVFTSPHLQRISERMQIIGMDVDDADVIRGAQELLPVFEGFVGRHGADYQLSFFEMLVFVSLRLFNSNSVDFGIYEAGIGGASDCTAMLPAALSVITNVAGDHHDKLGPTLECIAIDKAGIASRGSILIVGPGVSERLYSIIKAAGRTSGVDVQRAPPAIVRSENMGFDGWSLTVRLSQDSKPHQLSLPLIGEFQLDNLNLTIACLEALASLELISSAACVAGVRNTRWPGRLECFGGRPSWILDVASNEHALQAVVNAVTSVTRREACLLLFGVSDEALIKAALPYLERLTDQIAFVGGFYRSVNLGSLNELSRQRGKGEQTFESPEAAMLNVRERFVDSDATILGCGSLFLVGALRDLLLAEEVVHAD